MTTAIAAHLQTTCLSESAMVAYLEHRVSSEQSADIEVHIDGCATCRRMLVDLVSLLPASAAAAAQERTTQPMRVERGHTLANGSTVGRFVVLDVLGAGGMGVVYTAYDPELDRRVALKLLHRGARDAGHVREHLLAEAQVMARINHGNVTAIYDVGTYNEQVFAAMELVEGRTLRHWMVERSHTWRAIVGVFLLAGEGLAAAHAANVIHRDFKPENVLLGHDGRVKVCDFGLATIPAASSALIGGTPGYLAVERFKVGDVDQRSDQFSFCVALYEALHGRRPFSGHTFDDLVVEVRRGPAFEGGNPRIPGRLNGLLRRGLALDAEDRYPSMHELIAELRAAITMRQTRRRVALSLGALALVMGATAIRLDTHSDALQTPCTGAVEHLAGVWDPARRDALNSVLVGSAATAAASIDQVATVLDHYAADWATSWTEACEATKVRGEQSAEALEDRMKCLDRARIKLWAVGDLVVTGDAEIAGEATSAAAELPALDTCSDAAALRTVVSPPVAALARTQIDKSTREIQIKRRSISSRLPTLRSPRDSGCKATAAQHGGTPMKRYPQAAHTEPTTRTGKCTVSKIRPGKRSRS